VGLAALTTVTLATVTLALVVLTIIGPRVDRSNDMLSALQDGHIAMINQETGLRGFLVTREERFLEPYWKGAADLDRADAELAALARAEPDLEEHILALEAAEQDYIQQWAAPTLAAQPALGDTLALSALLRQDKRLFDRYRAVEGEVRVLVEDRRQRASDQRTFVVLLGASLSILVSLAVAIAVRRANRQLAETLLPPAQRVRDTLSALAAGDVDSRVPETGPAELRDIAGDVNLLGDALRERGELVIARERELMAARDDAERAGQAKTAFLATMSHEIRTPLNAVLGLTDLLLTTDLTEEQRGHLDTVSRSGDSLLMLINDILDFSKIEAGELDLEKAPFGLSDLVYDVAQLLAPQAAGKGLDLLVDISADRSWQVLGDGARLRQVVINLVGNAIKFTESGQVLIAVTADVAGPRLRCSVAVSDTGIGIPADQRHRLFRSFSQVDTSTTRSYGGTGLGLAISQRIARAMGGDIAVHSSAGAGSTFTVTVDLEPAPAAEASSPAATLAGRRLLVVDDNPTNLRILEHQLAGYGAVAVLVGSGPEALTRVATDPPFDACLLDLHMPGMDGDELAARLRGVPQGASLPLILLSSSAAVPADRLALFAARLHKPVRPERLEQTVRSALTAGAARPGPRAPHAGGVVPAPRRGEPGSRLRVLIAEDHAVNAQLMTLYLTQLGHDSDHVVNGELAVEAVRSGAYDVVLMDAQMPVLGGVDATAAIRCMPGPQPYVVAVTASVLASDRAAFLAAGADDFLTKPVRMATLDEALRQWSGVPAPDVAPVDVAPVDVAPVDAAPVAALPAPLDDETVEDLRDLGDDAFRQLYGTYAEGLRPALGAITAAASADRWAEEDPDSVPRLAHRLKGSSAAMGALGLADLCRCLQEAADGASADVSLALSALPGEIERVDDAVAALLGIRH
jgi:signal transduction histidine kinase/CheY-like chemotaxis protein